MFAQHQHQSSSLYRAPASGRPVVGTQRTPAPATWHHLATTIPLSRPQDPSEREADRVADAVMQGEPAAAAFRQHGVGVQRMCAACDEEDREEEAGGMLQAKTAGGAPALEAAGAAAAGLRASSGQPLAAPQREFFEPRFGRSFADVRLHTDAAADAAARSLNARAFTVRNQIAFATGQYAAGGDSSNRLLAHELAHVVQQDAAGPRVQRKEESEPEPPKMTASGDTVRESASEGVAIKNGTLDWKLSFAGQANDITSDGKGGFIWKLGRDVDFKAFFTPTAGASTCPTITFVQTVQPTTGGLWDTGPLLYTRSPATGASVDVLYQPSKPETEPFYGADPGKSGPGLEATPTRTITGTRAGASTKASLDDSPFLQHVPKGATAVRKFESAVICVETAETFGSIAWGYTKTDAGAITLQGGTAKDVLTTGASTGFETTRQAFYSGFFEVSLSDFAIGSATLTSAHETLLDGIDTKDLTRVILVGANDNSGGPEAKADLSLERAKAARDHLVKSRGVSGSLVRTEGHGVEARVPNPPGKDVPANRRVDVHVQRGAETAKPAHARRGSGAERKRLRDQNPRLTVDEAVDTIVRLESTTGRVPTDEWVGLQDMLDALDQWRSVDSTVPDLRKIYRTALKRLKDRAKVAALPERAPLPPTGPISPEVDEALRKYEEAKRRVEELKRERDQKLRELDQLERELFEEE
jgi:outer membrane protein OmpA-like peptidoglycan-associated protein